MSLGVWFAHLPRAVSRLFYPFLRYTNLMRAVEMHHVAPWVRNVGGWQVLDVGCGYGFYSLDFARRGARLVGCDLSPRALWASRQTAAGLGLADRATYLVADGSALPLPDEVFDLIFCNCVLEHVADDHQVLAEIYRTLRPDGLLYLTVDSAEHNLTLGFLEHLSPAFKRQLLRSEIAGASTIAQGLNDYLASIYDVRRRYSRREMETMLHSQGFRVLDQRSYISLLGAAHYEAFRLTRGMDPRQGLGRLTHMISSLLLYPFVVLVDNFQREHGYGLMFVASKLISDVQDS